MTLRFGPFELDEAGRALLHAQREVSLQPRVFDLLVYLTRTECERMDTEKLLANFIGPTS